MQIQRIRRLVRSRLSGRADRAAGTDRTTAPPPDFVGRDTAAVVALVFDLAGLCRDERDIARCAMRLGREIDRRDLAIALDEALWRLSRLSGLASAASASNNGRASR